MQFYVAMYGDLYCNSLSNLSLNQWKCNWHTEGDVLQLVYNMNKHSRVLKKHFPAFKL